MAVTSVFRGPGEAGSSHTHFIEREPRPVPVNPLTCAMQWLRVFTARWQTTASRDPTASEVLVLPGHRVCAELPSFPAVLLIPRETWAGAWSGWGSARDGTAIATFLS